MTYSPELLTEQEEGELLGTLTRLREKMGAEKYNAWADQLILQNKAYLLKHAKPDNPALIRLNELIRREANGFA